ncbi:uncharacterized protein [Montipora capricornis]|uniref:uncharacterized protein isoform X1 n=1 Tax=Montipora capricornis TaxID=246305 RepID=UPI0035F129BB
MVMDMWKACRTMKDNEILVWRYGLPITVLTFLSVQGRSDICEKQGLRQGWLNDEVVNFFMAFIEEACKKLGSLVKTDLLLMPINKRQNHWCLGGADMKKNKIMYYDPMGKCSDDFTEFSRNITLSVWLESSTNLCSVSVLFSLSACQRMIHYN